ncbi:MAG TPA: hypothetical protein VGX23_26325 [Actinocrinis sp.]|nr:hypothetical protein [Actinocrinis sp.]
MTGIGANLYPWDVVGDPACPDRIAALGADRVTLAAAYHTVRALTPRHPEHKVVTAAHSAVYYRPDPHRWQGSVLQPAEAAWSPRSFPKAAAALRTAGLKVYAWTVLVHNQRLGTMHPQHAVTNAYGDVYPWALCANSPEVREYCARLAGEVAEQEDIDGIELESCGWYGFDHLHAHDKTAGVALEPSTKQLMNLCFCAACVAQYADLGLAGLRADVRRALDEVFAGRRAAAVPAPDVAGGLAAYTDGDAQGGNSGDLGWHALIAARRMRAEAAARLRAEAVAAVRRVRPDLPVLLHASADPHAVGANPGCPPSPDSGAVLQCGVRSAAALAAVREYADAASRFDPPQPLAATVNIVAGLGGARDDLAAWCTELRAAGADELRFYHAGLASAADLAAAAEAGRAFSAG